MLQSNQLPKHWVVTAAALAILLLSAGHSGFADTATDALARKTADIALLKEQLADRRRQADAVLLQLDDMQSELINEIRILVKSYDISSVQDVASHPRLAYDLELLRLVLAYIEAFKGKIRFYQTGEDKLAYLQQMVQDDLKMSATMSHYEIDALTTQVSLLINKYLSEAHVIQIDSRRLDHPSIADAWSVVKRSNRRN